MDEGRAVLHIDPDDRTAGIAAARDVQLGLGAIGADEIEVIALDRVVGDPDVGGGAGHRAVPVDAGHRHDALAVVQRAGVDAGSVEVGAGAGQLSQGRTAVDLAALGADGIEAGGAVCIFEAGEDLCIRVVIIAAGAGLVAEDSSTRRDGGRREAGDRAAGDDAGGQGEHGEGFHGGLHNVILSFP